MQLRNLFAARSLAAAGALAVLLFADAVLQPAPAYAMAGNVEVQMEYGAHRCFSERHIDDYNISLFQKAHEHGSFSWHRGLVISASRGHTERDGIYRESNANGIGPAVMARWERPWSGKLHWALEGRGALLVYDKAFPAQGRGFGFKWHAGPRAVYHYSKNDSVSAGLFLSHSSNGFTTDNPGYNTVAWSIGWNHTF
ncbi:MAG: acyloxyacyl hydrolase [Acidaminococcaceae bacterium]|nr:acyloxyacyl hydrolase [Acidaminococcaceae bacterium]